MASRVTLEDVARISGVSMKTVSRVINNEGNVAPATLERVLDSIAKVKYVPHVAARNLSRGKATAIGLVAGWSVNSLFSSTLVADVLHETSRRKYNLVLFARGPDVADRVGEAFLGQQVDGIILDSQAALDSQLTHLLDSMGKPYVVIHPKSSDAYGRGSFVRIDEPGGAKQATEYLIGLGHRNIAVLSYPGGTSATNKRVEGYRLALEQAGIPFDKELVFESQGASTEIGLKGIAELFARGKEFTAVFAVTDEIALGAVNAIWHLGLKVPDDVSVVGFDDTFLASAINPPLTTIHQPIDEISRSAVELVIRMVEDPTVGREDVVLPTSLVVRDSCRSLAGGRGEHDRVGSKG